ncbi:hypothetical protein C1645_740525 [Glomus cerebriforme]|uniref:Uncharacterized protein n=1 Tax=Glomus cerebriforme TaxID=658196 RepID=A0A397SQH9_9GLOM|nr:hypothetical protein C1645_740525 [Glomus cerebriforme]
MVLRALQSRLEKENNKFFCKTYYFFHFFFKEIFLIFLFFSYSPSVQILEIRKRFLNFISDMKVSSQNFHLIHLLKESIGFFFDFGLEIWFAPKLGRLKYLTLGIQDWKHSALKTEMKT